MMFKDDEQIADISLDDINLDEFNFDDLPADEGNENVEVEDVDLSVLDEPVEQPTGDSEMDFVVKTSEDSVFDDNKDDFGVDDVLTYEPEPEYRKDVVDLDVVGNSEIVSSGNLGYLTWYSGSSDDKMFEFGKEMESSRVVADEECSTIHVNVGYDTYGWSVQFDDGLVMNLRDVREYQVRNGCLPAANGKIVYGKKILDFTGIKRIVVYERVRYFSYGM